MAQNKTVVNDASVEAFLHAVEPARKRDDCFQLVEMMEEITGEKAKMWGTSIVGFDEYHYKYASGREGDFMVLGFAPRKAAITLYLMDGFEKYQELLGNLGKNKTGKSCLYVKKLEDIDLGVLREMLMRSAEHTKATNPSSA